MDTVVSVCKMIGYDPLEENIKMRKRRLLSKEYIKRLNENLIYIDLNHQQILEL
jgi:hypothetical protein